MRMSIRMILCAHHSKAVLSDGFEPWAFGWRYNSSQLVDCSTIPIVLIQEPELKGHIAVRSQVMPGAFPHCEVCADTSNGEPSLNKA